MQLEIYRTTISCITARSTIVISLHGKTISERRMSLKPHVSRNTALCVPNQWISLLVGLYFKGSEKRNIHELNTLTVLKELHVLGFSIGVLRS